MHALPRPPDGPSRRPDPRRPLVLAALPALAAGLVYYAALRGAAPAGFADPSAGTFPSLVHGFATTLLLLAATLGAGRRHAALAVGANVALTAALERTIGTFDPNDLAALGLGTLVAVALARHLAGRGPAPASAPAGTGRARMSRRVPVALALLASTGMTVATGPYYGDDGYADPDYRTREPVYLSYDALREAVRVTEPRPLEDVGRVYLYEDFLFLNARNRGVHVIDNSDPSNPRPVSFIEIPGSTELAIRDGVLFADSYVDLVAIELASFGSGPMEVAREPGIFPWDPYQNVPQGTRFGPFPDEALGVVVGIEEDDR